MTAMKKSGLYIGLMSGTSADGIDAALCRFDPTPQLVASHSMHWAPALRQQIMTSMQASALDVDALGMLDTHLGEAFAEAVMQLVQKVGMDAADIVAIGSHGQTIRHRPQAAYPFTLQLGNPWVIAERTRIPVVADFRRADMAAGGQGAPLIPAFHAALFATLPKPAAILNLGGIANISVLQNDGSVSGFDTGPANALLDAWCQRHTGQAFDADGAFAQSGQADSTLLEQMLRDPYFSADPPKSTGREIFNLAWLEAFARTRSMAAEDVQACLLQLTAISIGRALAQWAPDMCALYVCGGGVHNPALMQAIAAAVSIPVKSTAVLGADPDFMEAMGFAWLARQHMLQQAGNCPAVTGARGPRVLGMLCQPFTTDSACS